MSLKRNHLEHRCHTGESRYPETDICLDSRASSRNDTSSGLNGYLKLSSYFLLGVTLLFCAPFLFSNGIVGNFGDIYQYAAPFRHFATESLQTGRVPLWNPYIFGGSPFLASPQSALFYPLTLLFYFLPLKFAFNLFTSLHIFINALGFYLLLKSLKYSNSTSLWGSLVWGFSSFFLSKVAAGHVIHLSGYSWFGFILLFALNSWKKRIFSLPFYCFILAYALQFFSGHLQVSFHTTIFIFLLFLLAVIPAKAGIQKVFYTKWILFSSLIFIALVLVQLLPTFTFLLKSMRVGTSSLFDPQSAYNFATSYSMRWEDLISLVIPNFFGNPITNNYFDPAHPSIFFETQATYFGLLPTLLVIAGNLYQVRKKRFLLPGLSALFLILAMGKNGLLYNLFWNMLSFLRVPARFFFLFLATSIFTAAIFWEEKVVSQSKKIKWTLFFLTFIDLFLVGRIWFWSEDPIRRLGRSPAMDWLQTQQQDGAPNGKMNRLFTTTEISNPNKTIFYHLKNFNGYEAILQKTYLHSFSLSQGPQNVSSTGAMDVPNPNEPFFTRSGVRYLVTLGSMNYPWPLKYNDGQVKIYENPNLNTLSQEAEFQYLYYRPHSNKIVLGMKGNGESVIQLKLLEANYPGWKFWSKAGIMKGPSQKEGYFQMVEFGSQQKYMKLYSNFRPKDFLIGSIISTLSVLLLSFLGMRALSKIKYAT